MTGEQLRDMARLTMTVRDVLGELRIIEQALNGYQPAIPERTSALLSVMKQLQTDVSALANRVQDARVREWLSGHPTPRLGPARTSNDVNHGVKVRRFGMDGRPRSESSSAPPRISGRWQADALGRPKPRRSSDDDNADGPEKS